MPRYLIEVPHDNSKDACKQAVQIFYETGSHFMTNADWGCMDDVHKAWFIVELDDKAQARAILPSLYRHTAKIVRLEKLEPRAFEEAANLHGS